MLCVRFPRRGSLCESAAPPLSCGGMTGKRGKTSRSDTSKPPGLNATRALGKLIRDAREAKGLTREDVRDRTGLSMTSQYHVEAGERLHDGRPKPHRIHTGTLVELAKLLGLTPGQLADCGRVNAAALLRAPSLPGELSDDDKARVAESLLLLRQASPSFAAMVEWIGAATGDVPPAGDTG